MTTAAVTDGRNARSRRTRHAVVDALLALLREGNPRPTAREIAARAEVSLRSVYVHFDDLDDLFLTAARRHFVLVSGLFVEVPSTGPLRVRAETWMRMNSRIFEEFGPVHRAAVLQAPFSPTLARMLVAARAGTRAEIERIFGTELDPLAPDERSRKLAIVDTLASADAWARLRSEPALEVAAARKAVAEAIIATLQLRGDGQ
jgi:TetR/AcrR family transcriptional regulator of autoinduction and epiphytic fitness